MRAVTRGSAQHHGGVLAVVVLAHLLLLAAWWLKGHSLRRDVLAPAPRMVWLEPMQPTPEVTPTAKLPSAVPSTLPKRQKPPVVQERLAPREPRRRPPSQAITVSAPQEAPAVLATTAEQAAPSAASAPSTSIMLTAGTLAAIKNAASAPLRSERNQEATGSRPPTRQEILARAISDAAFGDCLKGEYAYSKGYLLSIPFFILAEAAGKCSQ